MAAELRKVLLLTVLVLALFSCNTEGQSRETVSRFTSIRSSMDYMIRALRHVKPRLGQLGMTGNPRNNKLTETRLTELAEDAEKIKAKLDDAIADEGRSLYRHSKMIKSSAKQFSKDLKALTSDLKVAARSIPSRDRVQAGRDIKLLERAGKSVMERVKRLSVPVKPMNIHEGGAEGAGPTGSDTSRVTVDQSKRNTLINGNEPSQSNVNIARAQTGPRISLLPGTSPQSLMDVRTLENYMGSCPDCMIPSEQYQCPLTDDALDMQKWANELQDLVSFGCIRPEGCEDRTKCCIASDAELQQTIRSLTRTLKDLYMTFQKGCTKCNSALKAGTLGPEWATWSSWSSCSVTCGPNGVKRRERVCLNKSTGQPGQGCVGPATETARCTGVPACEAPKPEWTTWSQWSGCSVTCGRGTQYRSRSCQRSKDDPTRSSGCSGNDRERKECDTGRACCVNGNWASWGAWGPCSTTCGRGQSVRRRRCANPAPNYCGRTCPGTAINTRTCNENVDCCVDGNWSSWGSWGSCSATCGRGQAIRRRRCNSPAPNECGRSCPGAGVASRVCGQDKECCVDGNWSPWLGWTECSASCGKGIQSRIRRCDSPAPNFCGQRCTGPPFTTKECNKKACCVDGNWSSWSAWTQCSVTCGQGRRERRRQCSNPSPSDCGRTCAGPATEVDTCSAGRECEVCVDGNWGKWTPWSECSVSCGNGRKTRSRVCNNPAQSACGKPCEGDDSQSGFCHKAAKDGNWGSWEAWSACSVSCGRGNKVRRRACNNPAPDGCGFPCLGQDRDIAPCGGEECCVDGNWGSWQPWSRCSATCGRGERERRRSCDSPAANYCGRQCPGRESDVEQCDSGKECCVDGNWGSWEAWSSCSATCGRGTRERRRSCDSPSPNQCGSFCQGRDLDTDICQAPEECLVCVDGNWGSWSSWSPCPTTCGKARRTRTRSCDSPPANVCGRSCPGDSEEVKLDTCGPDIVDGQWTAWTPWSACSATCGVGSMVRSRQCSDPAPSVCGAPCEGISDERRTCVGSTGACECELKGWASWGSWDSCSTSCGYGVRSRSRSCTILKEGIDCGGGMSSCPAGERTETAPCLISLNCGTWGPWSPCSLTCSGPGITGVRTRRMMVDGREDSSQEESEECMVEGPPCQAIPFSDASWAAWASWCPCKCQTAKRSRRRECQRVLPGSEAIVVSPNHCPGDGMQEQACTPEQHCPECITSCVNKVDGQYPTCDNCKMTVVCSAGQPVEYRECERSSEWDAFSKTCVEEGSTSCMIHQCIRTCSGKEDGLYHDCYGCNSYIQCLSGQTYRRNCATNQEWNQIRKRCERARSPSCPRQFEVKIDRAGIIIGGAYKKRTSVHDRIAVLTADPTSTKKEKPEPEGGPVVTEIHDRIATLEGAKVDSSGDATQGGGIAGSGVNVINTGGVSGSGVVVSGSGVNVIRGGGVSGSGVVVNTGSGASGSGVGYGPGYGVAGTGSGSAGGAGGGGAVVIRTGTGGGGGGSGYSTGGGGGSTVISGGAGTGYSSGGGGGATFISSGGAGYNRGGGATVISGGGTGYSSGGGGATVISGGGTGYSSGGGGATVISRGGTRYSSGGGGATVISGSGTGYSSGGGGATVVSGSGTRYSSGGGGATVISGGGGASTSYNRGGGATVVSSGGSVYNIGAGGSGAGTGRGTGGGGGSSVYISGSGVDPRLGGGSPGAGSVYTTGVGGGSGGGGGGSYVSGTGAGSGSVGGAGASGSTVVTSGSSSVSGGGLVPVKVLNISGCVLDCKDAERGKYPSCRSCEHYIFCNGRGGLRERKCTNNRKWDDRLKSCRRVSSTCP